MNKELCKKMEKFINCRHEKGCEGCPINEQPAEEMKSWWEVTVTFRQEKKVLVNAPTHAEAMDIVYEATEDPNREDMHPTFEDGVVKLFEAKELTNKEFEEQKPYHPVIY